MESGDPPVDLPNVKNYSFQECLSNQEDDCIANGMASTILMYHTAQWGRTSLFGVNWEYKVIIVEIMTDLLNGSHGTQKI